MGSVPVAHADGVPGGNIADPVVRAVDIAKPAVVRIVTVTVGRLSVSFAAGQSVTFPTTPQNGLNGYELGLSGTGAFISAHGDLLTADHVVEPPKNDLDQFLDQLAAQDIANYINQNLKPTSPATPGQIQQDLQSGQLPSTSQYQQPQSRVYLSTDFSGPLTATSFQSIPSSQYAAVDRIEQRSVTSQKDVAIIHVSGMDNMPMLQLGDSTVVQQQDEVTVIGFPGNGDVGTSPTDLLTSSIINHVLVSSIKTTDSGAPVIQVNGNVEQGDSGGPALNSSGHIVGIVSFSVAATSGSTSFLQASVSAQPLIQAAGLSTAPSAFQQSWSKAFNDYASTASNHWHTAQQEFQQIINQYPQFKAINPFLQYATQQAQTEQTSSAPLSGPGGLNLVAIVAGGAALLIILLITGTLVASRRHKPAIATSAFMTPGYPTPSASSFGVPPGQGYGTFPASAPGVPQPGQSIPGAAPYAPVYPSPLVQQQQIYGQSYQAQPAPPASTPRPGYQTPPATPQSQPGYPPRPGYQTPLATPQPGYPPQSMSPAPAAGNMAAFGAPPVQATPPSNPASSDATLVAGRSGSSISPSSQWQTWPCGHTNRSDARFCGICGETAPPGL